IGRCLSADPEKRFATSVEVIAAIRRKPLRRIRFGHRSRIAAGVAVACVAIAGTAYPFRYELAQKIAGIPSTRHIAVLPVQINDSSGSLQVVADGLADTLTSELGRLEQFEK